MFLLEQVKIHNIHLVVGDFNARVGSDSHLTHPDVIARHCFYDTINYNGERLVSMCEEHKLRPVQMKFPQPKCRQWMWMHPTGSTHQMDHILINNKWSNFSRPKFDWNKLQNVATREHFQIELSNRFEALLIHLHR